jgi:hypothetical protein
MLVDSSDTASLEQLQNLARSPLFSATLDDLQHDGPVVAPPERKNRVLGFRDALNDDPPGADALGDAAPEFRRKLCSHG